MQVPDCPWFSTVDGGGEVVMSEQGVKYGLGCGETKQLTDFNNLATSL